MFMGIYWNYRNGYSNMGNLPKLDYVNGKTLGPTVDPSGMQDPSGGSLLWSVTWIKVL